MKICNTCKRTWEDDFRLCPIDGSSLQAIAGATDSNVGMNIGQCRIVEKIADGELGPIYKAEEPAHGVVAVQVIPPSRISSPIILEALGDAVKLAAKINHPRIVRVYSLETAPDGSAAVLMEYVEGTTLEAYRKSRPGMDIVEACGIVRQIAEGLIAAHRASLMHGALHPRRILITPGGGIKIGGFHRSGIREGVDAFTITPENLPYIAPECVGIIRDVPAPDYRADVYALGVILYEMLTARLPHEAKNLQELATLLESAPPLPPNFTNPQISPLLSRVVMKAIGKHPAERQASMDEFLHELDATKQPGREPQRPVAEPAPSYSSPYPPATASSSLFSSGSGQDSGLFGSPGHSKRTESVDNILPEMGQGKSGAEDGSFFGWFKTRIDRVSGAGRGSESRPSSSAWDDSSLAGASPARRSGGDDEFSERTVVVSGGGRGKAKRRSFSDTLADFRGRDADMTGTGTLPPRGRGSLKVWLYSLAGLVLFVGIILAVYFLFFSTAKGRLIVHTNPPGALIFICPEPCQDGALRPLTGPELKVGAYRLRVQMDGYETKEDSVVVSEKDEVPHFYDLSAKLPPPPVVQAPPIETTQMPPVQPQTQQQAPGQQPNKAAALAVPFSNALRNQTFFPDAPNNAWDILQRWQQAEAGTPSPAIEQAWQQFCRAVEDFGQAKLSLKDFAGARQVLDQLRTRMPGQTCASGLQASYDKAVSNDKANLMISAQTAMDRHSYVTPENDNALKYVRQIQLIDSNDADARRLDNDIFNRAWDQANSVAAKHQHQEAIDICNQLKSKYTTPPIGLATLQEFIQKQTLKAEQYQALKVAYAVQVKHGHGRNIAFWKTRECSGTFKIDGLTLEYKSDNEPEHSFKISYDALKEVKGGGDSVTIVSPGIRPDGRIELQEIDKRANPNLTQIYQKIIDYRQRYAEYMR